LKKRWHNFRIGQNDLNISFSIGGGEMAKESNITVTIQGLETEEDRQCFREKCAQFWMEIISQKISELPISHERKVEFSKEVVHEIHKKKVENLN